MANDYFGFSRRERIGILCLFCLVLIVFLLPNMIRNTNGRVKAHPDMTWIVAVKKLEVKDSANQQVKTYAQRSNGDYGYQYDRALGPSPSISLFYFDPNTLDDAGWEKLGVRSKTIRIIRNYLSKGGHFYKAADLQKIYGFSPNDYSKLKAYIKIETGKENYSSNPVDRKETKRFSYSIVDINTADTTAFIALPAIGSKLAERIIKFREKLGGFYSIDQVAEVYGLADSSFQKVKQYLELKNTTVKKININTATVDELKAHPYIKYKIAAPIIAYRNEHGLFSKLEDIKRVMVVTDEVYEKLLPYLAIN
jgi:competence ComEA-like helix-hairpin-helix protein